MKRRSDFLKALNLYCMNNLLITIFLGLSLFLFLLPLHAETQFETYMNNFYKKQAMASELLKEIETTLKNGSKERVCEKQKKAAEYGIEATKSLIKAFQINGSTSQMDDIKAGLNKWKDLKDNC